METTIRTSLPIKGKTNATGGVDSRAAFYMCHNLETLRFYIQDLAEEWTMIKVKDCDGMFYECSKLREILTPIMLTTNPIKFPGCVALEWVVFTRLTKNVDLRDSPLIRTDALAKTISNAVNSEPITITLHPDAYARVTEEIFAAAAAKNITIATP